MKLLRRADLRGFLNETALFADWIFMFSRGYAVFLRTQRQTTRLYCLFRLTFSRVHIHDLHFPQRLLALTKKYDVDPKYIEIELTESAFYIDTKNLNRAVDLLHEYGFRCNR